MKKMDGIGRFVEELSNNQTLFIHEIRDLKNRIDKIETSKTLKETIRDEIIVVARDVLDKYLEKNQLLKETIMEEIDLKLETMKPKSRKKKNT